MLKGIAPQLLLVLMLPGAAAAAQNLHFAPADILDWQTHSFNGETEYTRAERDGEHAVHARCNDSTGSGHVLQKKIDLDETPIMEWRWRVDAVYEGLDPHSKEGDDYPARIYVVDRHSVLRWRTRAINYVWANTQPEGSDWANPFTDRAHMLAVASGVPEDKGWRSQRRNLREDFQRFHDRKLDSINVVAIMTDCDNAGQTAEAWYGAIRFLPEGTD